jgi:hypothetical protein
VLLGGAVLHIGVGALLGSAVLGPVLLALVKHQMLTLPAGLLVAVAAAVSVFAGAGWVTLVAGLLAGRWRIPAGILTGALFWYLAGTPVLNCLSPTWVLAAGGAALGAMVWACSVWVLTRFVWPHAEFRRYGTRFLGWQIPFPSGRFAWTGLELRILLRDRRGWSYLLSTCAALWTLLGSLTWLPAAFGQVRNVETLDSVPYFLPAIYMGAFFLAGGPMRARGRDLDVDIWLRSLPISSSDYILSKGLVNLVWAGLSWVVFMSVASLLVRIPLTMVVSSLGRASLFASVTYSLAYLWGIFSPIRNEESLQTLVSVTLFSLTAGTVYYLTDQLELLISHALAPFASAVGLSLMFFVLAAAAEERRRGYVD